MSLKTLHLTNAWHATSGGIGTFYRSLLDAANAASHQLRLVVPAETDSIQEVGAYGRIYQVKSARAPLNGSYRFLYPLHFLKPHGRICEILNAEQPDLIEICDKYTLPYLGGLLRIGKLKGADVTAPIIGLSCERMDENLAAYFGGHAVGSWFCRWYMKNIYFPQFDYHIANSSHTAEELRVSSKGHKVRRGVWVRPMGVDCSRLSPQLRCLDLRRSLALRAGGSERSVVLLYVGRLVPEKNLGLLVSTMNELARRGTADYRLLIAGQGMSRTSFERACSESVPGRVLFLEHVGDREELGRLYASCDVFVHPNPNEPFGIAPLEAMASGIPLVAPCTGGITSYANASNAWLAPPDAVSFADAIEQARKAWARKSPKTASALKTAARHDWPYVAGQFLELYRDIALSFSQQTEPEAAPQFFSTLGDRWGREVDSSEQSVEQTSASRIT